MIQKLRWVLIVLVVVIVSAAIWSGMRSRAAKHQQAVETQAALRKTAEFLTPDTTSDIRFGKKSGAPTPPAKSVPAGP